MIQILAKTPNLAPRIKTLKDFNHDVTFFDDSVFHCNMPGYLPTYYGSNDTQEEIQMTEYVLDKLITGVASIGEFSGF